MIIDSLFLSRLLSARDPYGNGHSLVGALWREPDGAGAHRVGGCCGGDAGCCSWPAVACARRRAGSACCGGRPTVWRIQLDGLVSGAGECAIGVAPVWCSTGIEPQRGSDSLESSTPRPRRAGHSCAPKSGRADPGAAVSGRCTRRKLEARLRARAGRSAGLCRSGRVVPAGRGAGQCQRANQPGGCLRERPGCPTGRRRRAHVVQSSCSAG